MKPEIKKYKLTASDGAYVELSSLGAGIVSIVVPDRDGVLADVVLGYPDAESYFGDGPCAGKCPGRYGNRIAKGHFTLDGKTYTLPINNGIAIRYCKEEINIIILMINIKSQITFCSGSSIYILVLCPSVLRSCYD